MLRWFHGRRLGLRTTLMVVGLALVVWAVVVYVNLRDFVPEELLRP